MIILGASAKVQIETWKLTGQTVLIVTHARHQLCGNLTAINSQSVAMQSTTILNYRSKADPIRPENPLLTQFYGMSSMVLYGDCVCSHVAYEWNLAASQVQSPGLDCTALIYGTPNQFEHQVSKGKKLWDHMKIKQGFLKYYD